MSVQWRGLLFLVILAAAAATYAFGQTALPTQDQQAMRPERRLRLVEAIGHAAVGAVRRGRGHSVSSPTVPGRCCVAWEADRIALGVARSLRRSTRRASYQVAPRSVGASS
jgi:hypothetical protein